MNDRTVFNALIKEKSDTFNIMFAAAIAIMFLISIGGFCLPYIHMNAIEGSITPYISDGVFAISTLLATIVFFTSKSRWLASDKKLHQFLLQQQRIAGAYVEFQELIEDHKAADDELQRLVENQKNEEPS